MQDNHIEIPVNSAKINANFISSGTYETPAAVLDAALLALKEQELKKQALLADLREQIHLGLKGPFYTQDEFDEKMNTFMESRRPTNVQLS